MTLRTVVLTDYDAYLEYEYPAASDGAAEARAADLRVREVRLKAFPHSVVLQVAYPEMDYANRWCWQQFGPANGDCHEAHSNYPACNLKGLHSHDGRWLSHWLDKTDYDFGFNEWCFARKDDLDRFMGFVPQITWGEKFPK